MPVYYDLRPSKLSTAVAGTGADAGYCVVSVTTTTPTAGSNDTITLQAKSSSATVNVGGDTVDFSYAGGTAALTIGATIDNGNGTYVAPMYGAGSGSTTTTSLTATLNGNAVTTTMPQITVSSYATPDLVNNASFEEGDSPSHWDGFKNGAGSGDPSGVTLVTDQAYVGTQSVKYAWTANVSDTGAQMWYTFAAKDRCWQRFYFRLASGWSLTNYQKFMVFHNTDGSILTGWTLRSAAGLEFSLLPEGASVAATIISTASISNDAWHCLETDSWRNGDTGFDGSHDLPSAAFWFDGVQQTQPDGTTVGTYLKWKGGRLYPNYPTYGRVTSDQLNQFLLVGTRNGGNTGSGTCWIDRVALSSAGRIGP